jgi:hypothetical protein
MALSPTWCSQARKSKNIIGETQIRAITVASFQGRSLPPHWRARRIQQMAPRDSTVPTRSSSRIFPKVDMFSDPLRAAMGRLASRMRDMASKDNPPIGKLI